MSTIPVLPGIEPERAPHVTSSRSERTARRYLATWLALCFFLYIFPFIAYRSGVKTELLLSYWGSVINTSYTKQSQDADILIFGDSSAATNVDPVRLTHELRQKVIVLPNVSTSLPISGFKPLEAYLRHNKPPKLIIFYFSAWDLDFLHNPFTEIVEEGEEMLLIHGSWKDVTHYALHNPRKIIMFPLHFYGSSNRVAQLLDLKLPEAPRVEQGHIEFLSHPVPMQSDCAFDVNRVLIGQDDSSSREAVRQFSRPGTQTMVFLSPVPSCKHLELVEAIQHPGLQVLPPQVLPAASFRDDGWHAHMLTGSIGPSTDALEVAIRQRLAPQ